MKVLVLGASTVPMCGLRACAGVLEPELSAAGAEIETAWWERDSSDGLARTIAGARAYADRFRAAAVGLEPDVVLWHYSVFGYGPRGLPVAVPVLARAVSRLDVPVIGFLHEVVYPWGRRGVRGTVQAAATRAALLPLARALTAAVVQSEPRAKWLRTRRWLPRRPVAVVPVPSTIPPVQPPAPNGTGVPRVGVFGFGSEAVDKEPVMLALTALRRTYPGVRLSLVGAPGADSAVAARWRDAARAAGCPDVLEFTGVLDAEATSRALHALDAVIVSDVTGPTPRRTTFAAALAHGKAVVALDGPQRWQESVDAGAIVVVPRAPGELASSLERLLEDEAARRELGERARAFYERECSPAVAARKLLDLAEATA